jgi:coatomer subunit beta
VFDLIKDAIGNLPILDEDENKENAEGEEGKPEKTPTSTKPKVNLITADGTYATQSGLVSSVAVSMDHKPILRKLFYEGNFFLASSLATTLNKLFVRFSVINKCKLLFSSSFAFYYINFLAVPQTVNKLAGEAMLILVC